MAKHAAARWTSGSSLGTSSKASGSSGAALGDESPGTGSDKTALNNRRSDLAVYFKKFAKWINEVLDKSECQMDLMTGDGVADPQQVIKTFFDARASDVNLTETKATLKFTTAQIVAMRQGAQEFAAQETKAINTDSD